MRGKRTHIYGQNLFIWAGAPWRRAALLCALLACLCARPRPLAAEQTVIRIDNAQKTEYAKDPESGNEQVVLSGTVSLTVTRGSSTITISASDVIYDRVTAMLFAQGGVSLRQTTGGAEGGQDIFADTLLLNTSTLEGVFDNGKAVQTQSDALNLPSDSTLIVFSKMFGRDSSSTIAFKKATLTFCDADAPHWRIKASNIWLLPGGEFAFFNALLYVGHIPVLYLPAFYYPKDELLFNPTFGYSTRKGYYFQTTTYLLGRKPLDTSTADEDDGLGAGVYNFMKATTLKEQRREGLVLHNLDEDYKGGTTDYLKFMADYYTNLGGMVGLEGAYKPGGAITNVEGAAQLGFSDTVFYDSSSGSYVPYSNAGNTYSDSSGLLGLELPFRYHANFKLDVAKPLTFNLSLPVYSDPYFSEDFEDRSEYMDWISFLMQSGDNDDDDDTDASVSTFTWSASGSYSLPVPEAITPWVDTLSLTSFSSSIVFNSKATTFTPDVAAIDDWYVYTPERSFYYPSQVTPLKAGMKVAGTLYQYPPAAPAAKKRSAPSFPVPVPVPPELRDGDEDAEGEPDGGAEEGEDAAPPEEPLLAEDYLPELDVSGAVSSTDIPGLRYSLTYTIVPQFTSQLTYDSSSIYRAQDFEWSDLQSSYFQVKAPATLTSAVSYRDTFATMTNALIFEPVYQEHPNLDGYSETSAASVKRTDYNARTLDFTETNAVTFKPFIYDPVFKDSGLEWNTTVKLLRTEFLGDVDTPEWNYLTADLTDADCVTVHTLSATAAAAEGESFSQSLTLTTMLPPQNSEYTATLAFGFPYTTLSFAAGIEDEDGEGTWVWQPFQQAASVKVLDGDLSFTESFNYNLEDRYASSLKLALAWKDLQLAYTMSYTYGYTFDAESGWTANEEQEFLPDNASLAYSGSGREHRNWRNRVTWTPTLNSSIVYDCLRPTNSYFRFIPGLTFKINEFLSLTFSSESRNDVIYRYFQGISGSGIELPGETNLFKDLLNSFAFWGDGTVYDPDQIKRKSSGFKLKNFKIAINHDLHDWDLSCSFSVSPQLVTENGKRQYNFDPYMTLAVTWRPMSSMKAQLVDDYGEWELNP